MHITTHHGIGCNDGITIEAHGQTPGGAPKSYSAYYSERRCRPNAQPINVSHRVEIPMQNGDPAEVGNNGLTVEALLAIVKAHLKGWQSGPWACMDNQEVYELVEYAMGLLRERSIHGPRDMVKQIGADFELPKQFTAEEVREIRRTRDIEDVLTDVRLADLRASLVALPHIGEARAEALIATGEVWDLSDIVLYGSAWLAQTLDIDGEQAQEVVADIVASGGPMTFVTKSAEGPEFPAD